MKYDYISLTIENNVAIVCIDNPPFNILVSDAYEGLYKTFCYLSKQQQVKVIILTGAGQKAFISGANVREFLDFNDETGLEWSKRNQLVRECIRTITKPVICAINGLAFGGGCAIALVCDIRIAGENAQFNLGEINMGIIGPTQYLAHIAHSGTARKMIYSGETIAAQQALLAGIIDEVVPFEDLMERCKSLANKIALKSPLAIAYAKQCMITSQESFLKDGLLYEEEKLKFLWGTEDKNEAVKAFLEKRPPVFQGK